MRYYETETTDKPSIAQPMTVWLGPLTHILAGLLPLSLAYAYADYVPSFGAVALAVILSVLPDVDTEASIIGRWLPFISRPLESRFGHRTITHSWVALVLVGFVLYVIFPASWIWLFAAYASHLVIDMLIGQMGIPLFWPNQNHFFLLEIEPGSGGEIAAALLLAAAVIIPQVYKPDMSFIQDASFDTAIIQYQKHDGFYRSYAEIDGTTADSHIHIKGRFLVDAFDSGKFDLTCIGVSP